MEPADAERIAVAHCNALFDGAATKVLRGAVLEGEDWIVHCEVCPKGREPRKLRLCVGVAKGQVTRVYDVFP